MKPLVKYGMFATCKPSTPAWLEEADNLVIEDLMRRTREREKALLLCIDKNPRYYRAPSDSMLDGDEGIVFPALVQFTGKEFERYDIPQFFLRFPRALPVELKGIAV